MNEINIPQKSLQINRFKNLQLSNSYYNKNITFGEINRNSQNSQNSQQKQDSFTKGMAMGLISVPVAVAGGALLYRKSSKIQSILDELLSSLKKNPKLAKNTDVESSNI